MPELRSVVSGPLDPPLSTSMTPNSRPLEREIFASTQRADSTSKASNLRRAVFSPTLTKLGGDQLRTPVIPSAPWIRHGQTKSSSTLQTPLRSISPSIDQSDVVSVYNEQTTTYQTESHDHRSGRGPVQLPTVPVDVLPATFVGREHFSPLQLISQQSQPAPTWKGNQFLDLRWSSREGDASNTAKHQPVKSAEVDSAKLEQKEDKREDVQPVATAANTKRKRGPRQTTPTPRMPKTNSRPGVKYEHQWRIGQAPTAGLKNAREQTNYDRVLAAVSRYYQGNADATWKLALRHNASEYEGKGLTEAVGASVIMAAGLIAAGSASNATIVLDRTLPLVEAMLLSQHPQVCFWLLELSMDSSQTVAGHVRRTIKAQFAPLASQLLGPEHPTSLILRTPLTTEQQVRMRTEGQEVAHDYHVQTFGIDSYQTMVHQWYWGRIEAAAGQYDKAIGLLQDLTQTWEQLHATPNSAVVVTALVEQARVMVASGDASLRVECLLNDALRRIQVIASAQSDQRPISDATELRRREGGLIFSRLAALRTLGRVHVMRWNLNAAILCFEQAVREAEAGLLEQASARKLCESDLEATKMLELERAMGILSVEDPTSRLPPISSIVCLVAIETR